MKIATDNKKVKYGTTVRSCVCKHPWSDQRYGNQKRVHNYCEKGNAVECTVCERREKLKGGEELKK